MAEKQAGRKTREKEKEPIERHAQLGDGVSGLGYDISVLIVVNRSSMHEARHLALVLV